MPDIEEELHTQKRKVNFNSYDLSVKEIVTMIKDDIIDIAPEYSAISVGKRISNLD